MRKTLTYKNPIDRIDLSLSWYHLFGIICTNGRIVAYSGFWKDLGKQGDFPGPRVRLIIASELCTDSIPPQTYPPPSRWRVCTMSMFNDEARRWNPNHNLFLHLDEGIRIWIGRRGGFKKLIQVHNTIWTYNKRRKDEQDSTRTAMPANKNQTTQRHRTGPLKRTEYGSKAEVKNQRSEENQNRR